MKTLVWAVLVGYMFLLIFGALSAFAIPLAWEMGHAERASWSEHLNNAMKANLATFNGAKDVTDFCPKWITLDNDQKVLVLSTMAVEIARYESSFNPNSIYHEPPPLGIDSIGLYQLSYEDKFSWCLMDRKAKTLQNPLINIECAVPAMASLARRDGYIAKGSSGGGRLGLSRYWSVMWTNKKKSNILSVTKALAICK